MSQTEYKAKIQSSLNTRAAIVELERKLKAAISSREAADGETNRTNQLVINSIRGDPNFGEDSELYEACGYVRKSEKASGLHRSGKVSAVATQ